MKNLYPKGFNYIIFNFFTFLYDFYLAISNGYLIFNVESCVDGLYKKVFKEFFLVNIILLVYSNIFFLSTSSFYCGVPGHENL